MDRFTSTNARQNSCYENSMAYENSRLCDKVYTFFLKSRNYDALLYDFFRAPLFNEQEHIRTGG